jgi:hypothetical protein
VVSNNKVVLPPTILEASFRFSPLKCHDVRISLQAAKFLRWLYMEPERTNAQIVATFGMGLALMMFNAGYVQNPPGESDSVNTNLWSLTEKGVKVLEQLAGVK